MYIVDLIILIIAISVISIMLFILFFTRYGKNLLMQIAFNKQYVICHLKNQATDFYSQYKVVPKRDYLTNVGKGKYDLNPNYAALKWKGRFHFILDENDCIPVYPGRTNSNKEILIQVKEVKTALENVAYDFLYVKQKNLALIICAIGLAIALMVAIYAIYEIQQIKPMIQWLYEHPIQYGIPPAKP